jgi:hypothetical protein
MSLLDIVFPNKVMLISLFAKFCKATHIQQKTFPFLLTVDLFRSWGGSEWRVIIDRPVQNGGVGAGRATAAAFRRALDAIAGTDERLNVKGIIGESSSRLKTKTTISRTETRLRSL